MDDDFTGELDDGRKQVAATGDEVTVFKLGKYGVGVDACVTVLAFRYVSQKGGHFQHAREGMGLVRVRIGIKGS